MSVTDDLKSVFTQRGTGLMRIILINVAVFLVVNIVDQFLQFKGSNVSLLYLLALPGDYLLALKHCWVFITYMFLHQNLMHILFNMLWFYWLGNIFVEYVGNKRLVSVYILGGLSGGVLYTLMSLLFPLYFQNTFLLGASAGVLAVVIATAILVPNFIINLLFIGPVKLKYLALASFILSTVLDFSQNTGGKIAHLGGAIFGLIYMLQYKNGNDITKPINKLFDFVVSIFSRNPKIRVSYRKKVSDDEYNLDRKAKQERVDAILDKISKSGYDALTKEEKDFLFKTSGKL